MGVWYELGYAILNVKSSQYTAWKLNARSQIPKSYNLYLFETYINYYLCLDVSDILCDKISYLLKQITLAEYSKDWSLLSSLRDGSQATYPTVTESLSHYIDTVIEPILRGILGVIDSYQNLELLFSQTDQIRRFWKILFQDDNLLDLKALIEPTCLKSPESYLNHSPNISVFNCKFPFFFQVYKQVNQIYNKLINNLGLFLGGLILRLT